MNRLDQYKFSTKDGFNAILIKLRHEELKKYFIGTSCLELGCADGEGTKLLIDHFERIVAVDGSKKLIDRAKKEILNLKVSFIHSYFETLQLQESFDTVLLLHILEHVDDPVGILKQAKKFVRKGGKIILDVPNAMSIHRQVGVLMGMIDTIYTLNSADLSIGHKRVYDRVLLMEDIHKAALHIESWGGIFLKPFSNKQMHKYFDSKAIYAFNELGRCYPEIAAEIYVVCTI